MDRTQLSVQEFAEERWKAIHAFSPVHHHSIPQVSILFLAVSLSEEDTKKEKQMVRERAQKKTLLFSCD